MNSQEFILRTMIPSSQRATKEYQRGENGDGITGTMEDCGEDGGVLGASS